MMISKKSAVMLFYYLIAVDKNVSDEELDTYESIANEIDPNSFSSYSESIAEEYRNQISKMIDEEDFYDIILEGVDIALHNPLGEDEQGVSSRYLLWNLLVVAYCDDEYSNEERRLIKHIVRVLNIENDVFLEMEQLMKANVAVGNELETIEKSDKPYNEIRPMVEELEKRREVIVTSAKTLIEDELYVPVDKLELDNKFEIDREKIINESKEKFDRWTMGVSNTVTPIASNINDKTKQFLGNIMTKKNK